MNNKEQQEKLTRQDPGLYAERRYKVMENTKGEVMPFPTPEQEGAAVKNPEKEFNQKPLPEWVRGAVILGQNKEIDSSREQGKKPSVLENFGITSEKFEKLWDSKHPVDEALAMGLLELDHQTKEQPVSEWEKEKLALLVQDWQGLEEILNDFGKREDSSREDKGKICEGRKISSGVRKFIISSVREAGREDEVDFILNAKDRVREKGVFGNNIKTREARNEFLDYLKNEPDNALDIESAIGRWEEIEERMGEGDPVGKMAAQNVLDSLRRKERRILKESAIKISRFKDERSGNSSFSEEKILPSLEEEAQEKASSPYTRDTGVASRESKERDKFSPGYHEVNDLPPRAPRKEHEGDYSKELQRDVLLNDMSPAKRMAIEQMEQENRANKIRPDENANYSNEFASLLNPGDNRELPGSVSRTLSYQDRLHAWASNSLQEKVAPPTSKEEEEWKKEMKKWAKEERENWIDAKTFREDLMRGETKDGKPVSWSDYEGWDEINKGEVKKVLESHVRLSPENAEKTLPYLLLSGYPAKEIASMLSSDQVDPRDILFRITEKTGVDKEVSRLTGIERKFTERFMSIPNNVEDLAWQISHAFPDVYGEEGKTPIFNLKVEEEGEVGKKTIKVHEVVNKDNVLNWERDRIFAWHDQEEKEIHDYFQKVEIPKYPYGVNLQSMINQPRMFISGEGLQREAGGKVFYEDYEDLRSMMIIEAYLVQVIRSWQITYEQNMGQEEELMKQLQSVFYQSLMTKRVFGKSLWSFYTTLSENFDGYEEMDGNVGAAAVKMLLAFKYLSNYDKLKETLGEDCPFFNAYKLKNVRDGVLGEEGVFGKVDDYDLYFNFSFKDKDGNVVKDGDEIFKLNDGEDWHKAKALGAVGFMDEKVNRAFNIDGSVKDKKALITLINFYNDAMPSTFKRRMVERAIRDSAADRIQSIDKVGNRKINKETGKPEEMSDLHKKFAMLIASHTTRWTGVAAENDINLESTKDKERGFIGYDAATRILNPRGYRNKLASYRMGALGNPFTVSQFGKLGVNVLSGIKTLRGDNILEVLLELNSIRDEMIDPNKTGMEKKELERKYQDTGSRLQFKENSEQNYLINNLYKGVALDQRIRGAKELRLADYVHSDPMVGVVFDREKFQEDLIKGLVTPARYLFNTYPDLDYSKKDYYWDHDLRELRNMPLGEAMFGKQMIEPFLRDPKYRKMGKNGWEVDWGKVNTNNKTLEGRKKLFRQWVLTYVAGQIIEHRSLADWSSAERYEFWFYDDVVEMLNKTIGGLDVDSEDMRNTKKTKSGFSKEELEWLREIAHIKKWSPLGLYNSAIIKSLFIGRRTKEESVLGGLGEAFGIFVGAVMSGH